MPYTCNWLKLANQKPMNHAEMLYVIPRFSLTPTAIDYKEHVSHSGTPWYSHMHVQTFIQTLFFIVSAISTLPTFKRAIVNPVVV